MRVKIYVIYVLITLVLSCSTDCESKEDIYNESCLDAVSFDFSENNLNIKKSDSLIVSTPINSRKNIFILIDSLRQRLFSTIKNRVYLFDCNEDELYIFEDNKHPILEDESRMLDTVNGKYILNLRNAFYIFNEILEIEYSSWSFTEEKKLDTIASFEKYLTVDIYQDKNRFVDTIYVFYGGVNTMSRYKFTDTIIFEGYSRDKSE